MTCYLKGKDGKIKNIEQLDNIENRGIEIRYKTNKVECIEAGGQINIGDNINFIIHNGNIRYGFTKIKPVSQLE